MYCPKCKTPLAVKPECLRCNWKSHEQPLDRPGTVCNIHNLPSVENRIVVQTLSGKEMRGLFSQYGTYDRRRSKAKLFLKPGFIFVRWEVRCEKCQ